MYLEPPWKKVLKPRHRQQEEGIEKLGGRRQPASGRLWRFKRDGVLRGFLIEARTTEKRKYTIDLDEWLQIEKEAHMTPPGCLPAMMIEIAGHTLMVTRQLDFQDRENRLSMRGENENDY